jgi:hypothetical protein
MARALWFTGGTCTVCGLPGQHLYAAECWAAMRLRLAKLEQEACELRAQVAHLRRQVLCRHRVLHKRHAVASGTMYPEAPETWVIDECGAGMGVFLARKAVR